MRSLVNSPAPGQGNEPFWKRLFSRGDFSWGFQMRRGDAEEFFAPQDEDGRLLAEKRRWLDANPARHVAVTPAGEALVEAAWELALEWGHVGAPPDGSRDLLELARQWEPDLLLMDRETMTVAAGCVCLPSSWSLEHTAGIPLHEVHGRVPRLNP